MPSPNEHYLYDAASFLDRNIPTRNDLISLDNRLFGDKRALGPDGESYESRLRRLMSSLPLQDAPREPGAPLDEQIDRHAVATQDLLQRATALRDMQGGTSLEIPADLRPPFQQTTADGIAYRVEGGAPQGNPSIQPAGRAPVQAPAPAGSFDAVLKNLQDGDQMPPRLPDSSPASLTTQVDNINNQTMRAANGKAQEAESVSDLQKMLREYFGGRTQEQKQKDAFMNIAAGLASGKSPRFMDNLGSAVSGAITYDRDADKNNKKEALDMMLKDQGQQLDNDYHQGSLGISGEKNAIDREELGIKRDYNDILKSKAGAASNQTKLYAVYYATAARQARSARDKIDPTINPEAYAMYDKQAKEAEAGYMAAVSAGGGGGGGFVPPEQDSSSADIVYDKVGSGFKQTGKK